MLVWPNSAYFARLQRAAWRNLLREAWQRGRSELANRNKVIPPGRRCGDGAKACTACCKALEVRDGSFYKPIHRWCKHAVIGKGCGEYNFRPPACVAFKCMWLKGLGTEDERPDKTGVIYDFTKEGFFSDGIVQVWEVLEGALARRPTQLRTEEFVQKGTPVVHIPIRGSRTIYFLEGTHLSESMRKQISAERMQVKGVSPARQRYFPS